MENRLEVEHFVLIRVVRVSFLLLCVGLEIVRVKKNISWGTKTFSFWDFDFH